MEKTYSKFEDFDLSNKLQEAVIEARLEKPTELQREVIPLALQNKDVIFEARSGMGKSACFAIPFLQHWLRERNRKAIIITPAEETVNQLYKVIARLCPTLKAKVLKFTKKDDYFYPELHEKCPIVILELAVAQRFIKREKDFVKDIKSLGLDELDRLLLREQELTELIHALSTDRQTLICANELNEQILEKGRWFCDPNRMEKVKLSRPETQWTASQVKLQYVITNDLNRTNELLRVANLHGEKIVMVITDSDRVTRFLVEKITETGKTAEALEYSMQLDAKQTLVSQVVEKGQGILVGCEAALNGLNLPKVDHLISWELPSQLENYWTRLDRFTSQGELYATVIIDQHRVGAVRILERRLGRPMQNLTLTSQPQDRGRREPAARAPRPAAPAEKKEEHPKAQPKSQEQIQQELAQNVLVIPVRFSLPVFALPRELKRFAPEGTMKKNIGSKFMPARKKKAKNAPSE